MSSLSPLSGNKQSTIFTFSISPEVENPVINWGDGSFSYGNTSTHVYSSPGIYSVVGGSCSSTFTQEISVYYGDFFRDTISVSYSSLSAYTSFPNTYTVSLTSELPINTIMLYSSGSNALPLSDNLTFWSHLNPEWHFEWQGTPVSEITLSGNPILSGTTILGYSATTDVDYFDDMPGQPKLLFTVVKDDGGIPINSRVYSTIQTSICATIPDKLFITADGLNPITPTQWADQDIPYVISVGSTQNPYTNILHYVTGNIVDVRFASNCFGLSSNSYYAPLCAINAFDDRDFPTGGYVLTNFRLPGSALPAEDITTNYDSCNVDYSKLEIYKNRNTPQNTVISAIGEFMYDGNSYTLSGISNQFNIYYFENIHDFYRKGEDVNIYEILKRSFPFDIEQHPNFNLYLSAIAGEGDTLGKVYDKIYNFSTDHSDVDLCTIDSLISNSQMLDSPIDDFGLDYPEELKRLMNYSSIPLQKLIGSRCSCNMNFESCVGCANSNICTICKFDKRSNVGEQLTLNDYVTAGQTLLYKEKGSDVFNFLYVSPLTSSEIVEIPATELATEDYFTLTTEDGDALVLNYQEFVESIIESSIYKLKFIQNSNLFNSVNDICFYEWNSVPQNNPIGGMVNYKDTRNMLSPTLSSNDDWYGDSGVLEEIFNFILTKNLVSN